jgi:hypothetical protein
VSSKIDGRKNTPKISTIRAYRDAGITVSGNAEMAAAPVSFI